MSIQNKAMKNLGQIALDCENSGIEIAAKDEACSHRLFSIAYRIRAELNGLEARISAIPVLALSVPAAARATGRSRARMFDLVKTGAIKAKKEGASTLITMEELQRWLGSLADREI